MLAPDPSSVALGTIQIHVDLGPTFTRPNFNGTEHDVSVSASLLIFFHELQSYSFECNASYSFFRQNNRNLE